MIRLWLVITFYYHWFHILMTQHKKIDAEIRATDLSLSILRPFFKHGCYREGCRCRNITKNATWYWVDSISVGLICFFWCVWDSTLSHFFGRLLSLNFTVVEQRSWSHSKYLWTLKEEDTLYIISTHIILKNFIFKVLNLSHGMLTLYIFLQ